MIDKNINIIIFSLTVLGKTNREISVAITIHPHAACFFSTETSESDSDKNNQKKNIRCLPLRVKS